METNLSNMHFVSIQKNQRVWRLKKVVIPISSSKRRHFLCERKVFVIFKLLHVFLFLFVEQRGMKFIRLLQHDFHLSVCNGAFGLSRCCTHRSSSSNVIFTKAVKTLVLMCSEFTSAQRKVFYDWWIQPGIEPETQYFSDHSRRSRPLNRTSPLSL
jgi:hypothetical protein